MLPKCLGVEVFENAFSDAVVIGLDVVIQAWTSATNEMLGAEDSNVLPGY